jgi:hypothetical protein
MDNGVKGAREVVITAQHDPSVPLGRLFTCNMVSAPSPTKDRPHSLMLLDEPGPSNSPKFYWPPVFTGIPISQPNPPGLKTTQIQNPDGTVTMQTLDMDTLTCEAGSLPPLPHYFPLGKKLQKKRALPEDSELSIFNILNIFQCHWFLSVAHLWAQALLAQKADDRNIFWVEFTPQFHAHLVKCTVVLVPRPISKVKKTMFVYILELLNKEAPQAFFDLTKGNRWASTTQRRRSGLHTRGTTHRGRSTIRWLKKLSKVPHNGNVKDVDVRLHPTNL